jgi:hypothetical protein
MATFNATSDTNNVNQVLWGWSTKLEYRTDRAVTGTALHGAVQSVENLGVGVSAGDPFTLLT